MNRPAALALALALSLAGGAAAATREAPIVVRAMRAAKLFDHDGAPDDSLMGASDAGVDGGPTIRSLDGIATGLDAHLRTHPRDFSGLIARARIERVRWMFAAIGAPSRGRIPGLPSAAILGADPRPRIAAWLERAAAARPESGEPHFWLAFLYADRTIQIMAMGLHARYETDPERSLRAAREAYRRAPDRRYLRALLVADLLRAGLDEEAARVGRGGTPAAVDSVQVAQLLSDRALFTVPAGARYDPRLRELFAHGQGVGGPEDASAAVTAARTSGYALRGDAAQAVAEYERLFPGMRFVHSTPDSEARGMIPFADTYFGRMRWTLGGQLEPIALAESDPKEERDAIDLMVLDFDYGNLLGVPRDSVALREKVRTSVLFIVDRRKLAP